MSRKLLPVTYINPLEWPTEPTPKVEIEKAGVAYVNYLKRVHGKHHLHTSSSSSSSSSNNNNNDSDKQTSSHQAASKVKAFINLLDYSETEIEELTFYEVLGVKFSGEITSEQIKKAYHKACLKYHPDKTGRGEEDYIFLRIKLAYDTLRDDDKRRSYDSNVEFDDAIPKGGECAKEFYETYRPVFERNMRFAAVQDKNAKKKVKKVARGGDSSEDTVPVLGDESTPIEEVHRFYDYWANFESWRDFSFKAAELCKHDVDAAEGRWEKRYMEKEINKKAKLMKREENARITMLVERAMASDPRIKLHKKQLAEEKKKAAAEREAKKRAEEEAIRQRKEKEAKEEAEKEAREQAEAAAKRAEKDKQKKIIRKSKQLFRKLSLEAYESDSSNTFDSLEKLNDDVEFLCERLSRQKLDSLSDILQDSSASNGKREIKCAEFLSTVRLRVKEERQTRTMNIEKEAENRRAARHAANLKEEEKKAKYANTPFSKEELAALAKAVKKYPSGGANRWETIAMFINNLLKPEIPRTKEECIAQYNSSSNAPPLAKSTVAKTAFSKTDDANNDEVEQWTEAQDKELQEALGKFPASMDKNERWSSIAKAVGGKSKKQCVQRFKAIREALKQRK